VVPLGLVSMSIVALCLLAILKQVTIPKPVPSFLVVKKTYLKSAKKMVEFELFKIKHDQ